MTKIQEYEKKIFQLKKQIDGLKPFDKYQIQNLKQRFQVAFTYNSNAIEGNTFSLQEVKVLVEDGITVGGKSLRELKETENHAKLVNKIWEFFDKAFELSNEFILNLYSELMTEILDEEKLWEYRDIQVFITGEEIPPPSPAEIPELMNKYIQEVRGDKKENELKTIAYVHYQFAKIHPLIDGNGRVARLLMNLYFIKYGYFPIIFPIVVRNEYIQSLSSNNEKHSFDKFYEFFLRQTYENMKDYLRFFEK